MSKTKVCVGASSSGGSNVVKIGKSEQKKEAMEKEKREK
jgi:hypothetical protein